MVESKYSSDDIIKKKIFHLHGAINFEVEEQ